MVKAKNNLLPALIGLLAAFVPASVQADGHVGIWVGDGGRWHDRGYTRGYYPGYYPGWVYPEYYVVPPPVIYQAPPVTYAYPAAPVYEVPRYTQPGLSADQTSPTYTDQFGRSCRNFQSGPDYNGKACLQSDGSWRIVP